MKFELELICTTVSNFPVMSYQEVQIKCGSAVNCSYYESVSLLVAIELRINSVHHCLQGIWVQYYLIIKRYPEFLAVRKFLLSCMLDHLGTLTANRRV